MDDEAVSSKHKSKKKTHKSKDRHVNNITAEEDGDKHFAKDGIVPSVSSKTPVKGTLNTLMVPQKDVTRQTCFLPDEDVHSDIDFSEALASRELAQEVGHLKKQIAELQREMVQYRPRRAPQVTLMKNEDLPERMPFPAIAAVFGDGSGILGALYHRAPELNAEDDDSDAEDEQSGIFFSLPKLSAKSLGWWMPAAQNGPVSSDSATHAVYLGGESSNLDYRRQFLIPQLVEKEISFFCAQIFNEAELMACIPVMLKEQDKANVLVFTLVGNERDFYTYAQIARAVAQGHPNVNVAYNYELSVTVFSNDTLSENVIGPATQHTSRERHGECIDIVMTLMEMYTEIMNESRCGATSVRVYPRIFECKDGTKSLDTMLYTHAHAVKRKCSKAMTTTHKEIIFKRIQALAPTTDTGILLIHIFAANMFADVPFASLAGVYSTLPSVHSVVGEIHASEARLGNAGKTCTAGSHAFCVCLAGLALGKNDNLHWKKN